MVLHCVVLLGYYHHCRCCHISHLMRTIWQNVQIKMKWMHKTFNSEYFVVIGLFHSESFAIVNMYVSDNKKWHHNIFDRFGIKQQQLCSFHRDSFNITVRKCKQWPFNAYQAGLSSAFLNAVSCYWLDGIHKARKTAARATAASWGIIVAQRSFVLSH